jgi:hypothetical protein
MAASGRFQRIRSSITGRPQRPAMTPEQDGEGARQPPQYHVSVRAGVRLLLQFLIIGAITVLLIQSSGLLYILLAFEAVLVFKWDWLMERAASSDGLARCFGDDAESGKKRIREFADQWNATVMAMGTLSVVLALGVVGTVVLLVGVFNIDQFPSVGFLAIPYFGALLVLGVGFARFSGLLPLAAMALWSASWALTKTVLGETGLSSVFNMVPPLKKVILFALAAINVIFLAYLLTRARAERHRLDGDMEQLLKDAEADEEEQEEHRQTIAREREQQVQRGLSRHDRGLAEVKRRKQDASHDSEMAKRELAREVRRTGLDVERVRLVNSEHLFITIGAVVTGSIIISWMVFVNLLPTTTRYEWGVHATDTPFVYQLLYQLLYVAAIAYAIRRLVFLYRAETVSRQAEKDLETLESEAEETVERQKEQEKLELEFREEAATRAARGAIPTRGRRRPQVIAEKKQRVRRKREENERRREPSPTTSTVEVARGYRRRQR